MFVILQSRWAAFGIHLLISLIIFLALSTIIFFVWYPGFLFYTDGGWQGIRLIAGIDLVLGPILTLLIYNKDKPSLKVDLAIIALIQICALTYGSILVYAERPIAVIYANNQFTTMSNSSYKFHGIDWENIELLKQNNKPVWIDASASDETKIHMRESQQRPSLRLATENYRRLNADAEALHESKIKNIPGFPEIRNANEFYFKMITRYFEGYLVIDVNSLDVTRHYITKPADKVQAIDP